MATIDQIEIPSGTYDLVDKRFNTNNVGFHNSIYRGKSLGTSVTSAQWTAISNGTFDDMYIGDYWTISNVDYVIAGFDYWWNCGDSFPSGNVHHVVLVPRTNLYAAQMNTSNTTTGGYVASAMFTTNLETAKTTITNAFGSAHIYSHRVLLTSSVTAQGEANGWAWATVTVDLMSEVMVYGHEVWGRTSFETGADRTILPIFALSPNFASIRAAWWLRSVASPSYFALVATYGYAYFYYASYSYGVRPAFAIF